ncbi:MAG: polysaccharide deacetylase family protein [Gemmatimonadales bacterium]
MSSQYFYSPYPKEPPRPRAPWAWAGAILLLCSLAAGLLSAAFFLWRFIDIDSVLEAATLAPPPRVVEIAPDLALPELTGTAPWVAHLYVSRNSAVFFPDKSYYAALGARWGALLEGAGASVRQISGAESVESLGRDQLLVVPAAVCLSAEDRAALARHVERGGHLLASWATGARGADCEWLGYDFMSELASAEAVGTLERRSPTFLAIPHGSALAAGLPPGIRIELRNEPWIALRSPESIAFWSDWALNPRAGPYGGAAAAATAVINEAGGRVAWFGFRLDMGATDYDQQLIDRFVQNAALWAAGHVMADVDPWPGGYRAAMAVTQDVEHDFGNSRLLARRFLELEAPITFFVVSKLVRQDADLAKTLLAAGEVGSHTVDHRQVAGRLWGNQLAALRQARNDVRGWAGERPLGLRPPREVYDQFTLEAWRRYGGLYIAGTNRARSAAPEIFTVPSGRVAVLPRVVDDDYAVMIVRGRNSADSLQAALSAALHKMRSLGGLNLVTLHTQLIDSQRRVDAIESVVREARAAGDVWIAGTAELADWWLRRSQLEVRVRERADLSAIVSVRNGGHAPIASAWVHVHLPGDAAAYAAPEVGEDILDSEYGRSGLRIKLPTLEPGQFFNILLPRHAS